LAARNGERARADYLALHTGTVSAALVAAARAMNGRSDLLRIAVTLRSILWGAPRPVVRAAIIGIAKAETAASDVVDSATAPEFVLPLVKVAVERVSDAALSAAMADSLAALLGSVELDADGVLDEGTRRVANDQTMRLVGSLITEVSLTASSRALASLGFLLRRDFARTAFCRRDGVSTLASTLLTDPTDAHPSIGKAVASADVPTVDTIDKETGNMSGDVQRSRAGPRISVGDGDGSVNRRSGDMCGDAVSATYQAARAVWMLSFAASAACVRDVLSATLSSRLVLVLSKLLDHVSGRRLKIARVVLATLRNLSSGSTDLHIRVRREMIGAGIPSVLHRLSNSGTVIGRDDDASEDAQFLTDTLASDLREMSTLDLYLGELRSGSLRWSSIHSDEAFGLQMLSVW
jgi:V-ATPase subunit H